ncbi:hypothetical protein EDD21DRAFT_403780 [Dissophora ornata]|nr:hypothetical protein EDD21DRAFT_403780 [Dissophora ornata]
MAAHNFPSADNSSHTATQGTSLASQSGRADLPVPPRAPLTVQDQVEFFGIEMPETISQPEISQPETQAPPAPIDGQGGRGDPREYGVTPPRAAALSAAATFVIGVAAEMISQSETRAPPAPIESQEGRGYPWEHAMTPSPRVKMLSTVATFLSLCLYLAYRVYVSDH